MATVDFMQRHGPLANSVSRVVQERLLGAPLHAYFENYAADEDLPSDHWFWDASRSGGIFVEHAVHFFDLFRWWFGDGTVLSATATPRSSNAAAQIVDQVTCTTAHGSVLVHQYHGFHQPNVLDRQRLGIVFEDGDILLNGWIPVSARVRALVDGDRFERLRQLFPGAVDHRPDTPVGTRGRGRAVDDRHDVTITTPEADKPTLYHELLRARFTDAVAAIDDPTHAQRVTAADAAAAVALAAEATRIAQLVTTSW
jgi:predicted dehydrogenase